MIIIFSNLTSDSLIRFLHSILLKEKNWKLTYKELALQSLESIGITCMVSRSSHTSRHSVYKVIKKS